MTGGLTRRRLLGAGLACGGLALVACSSPKGSGEAEGGGGGTARAPAAAPRLAAMTVYRDPGCGCCEAWADLARAAGHPVRLVDTADMAAIKARHKVPEALASCHTAIVDGLAIEGHVPLAAVDRLLRQRPAGVRGIAVPGMPAGSPGMETPDGRVDPFVVMAFDDQGRSTPFKS